MYTLKDKDFCIDSLELITGVISFCDSLIEELKHLCLDTYADVFKDASSFINSTGERIDAFANKWEDDSESICRSLKTIKEYYAFYCVTLNNSSPTSYNKDARYIIDSLKTSKLALSVKLKKIEANIK